MQFTLIDSFFLFHTICRPRIYMRARYRYCRSILPAGKLFFRKFQEGRSSKQILARLDSFPLYSGSSERIPRVLLRCWQASLLINWFDKTFNLHSTNPLRVYYITLLSKIITRWPKSVMDLAVPVRKVWHRMEIPTTCLRPGWLPVERLIMDVLSSSCF